MAQLVGVSSCIPKGGRFYSQSRHMLRMQACLGAGRGGSQPMFPLHMDVSPSLYRFLSLK